jgi:hypothetical protein
VEPAFQHAVATNASEANKAVGVWRAVSDDLLDFKPHAKVNTIRTIITHQLLWERRFFAEFAGLDEPPVAELLPPAAATRGSGPCSRQGQNLSRFADVGGRDAVRRQVKPKLKAGY